MCRIFATTNQCYYDYSGQLNFRSANAQDTLTGQSVVFNSDATITCTGYVCRAGTSGAINANITNLFYTGTALQVWVNLVNLGNATICDYRLKENIKPPSNVLERLCSLEMFNYELRDIDIFKKNGTHLGCRAHELKEKFPELDNIVFGEKDDLTSDGSIQPQSLTQEVTNLLMRAIQELSLEVEQLKSELRIKPKYQPVGTIIIHVSLTLELPYLLCNGQAISRVIFASLFNVIGINYGKGDGLTTFNIPNYSGMFLKHQKFGMYQYILAMN